MALFMTLKGSCVIVAVTSSTRNRYLSPSEKASNPNLLTQYGYTDELTLPDMLPVYRSKGEQS